jgi:hypothetical protein
VLGNFCIINHKHHISVTPLHLTVLVAVITDCTVFQPFNQSRQMFLSLFLEFMLQCLPTAVSYDSTDIYDVNSAISGFMPVRVTNVFVTLSMN